MEWVYVIKGESGEHSDQDHWVVAVHTDEENARQHVKLLTDQIEAARGLTRNIYTDQGSRLVLQGDKYSEVRKVILSLQSSIGGLDGTGTVETDTRYHVIKTPMVRHVDEYMENDSPKTEVLGG